MRRLRMSALLAGMALFAMASLHAKEETVTVVRVVGADITVASPCSIRAGMILPRQIGTRMLPACGAR